MAEQTTFTALQDHKFMSVKTFRKSGVGVPTTVWFVQVNGKLYFSSPSTTGKVKRLRNNPQVTIAPSDGGGKLLGEEISATARRVEDENTVHQVENALRQRYGMQKRMLDFFFKTLRRIPDVVYEVTPL